MITRTTLDSLSALPTFTHKVVPLLKFENLDGRNVLHLVGWVEYRDDPPEVRATIINKVKTDPGRIFGWFRSELFIHPGGETSTSKVLIELAFPTTNPDRSEETDIHLADAQEVIIANACDAVVSDFRLTDDQTCLTGWRISIAEQPMDVMRPPKEHITSRVIHAQVRLLKEGMAELQESLTGQTRSRTRNALGLPRKR